MKTLTKKQVRSSYLLEGSWEVVNPVGGIYTVLRSKSPEVKKIFGDRACMAGPFVNHHASVEFIQEEGTTIFHKAAEQLRAEDGFQIQVGRWLISGRPLAALIHCDESLLPNVLEELEDLMEDSLPPLESLHREVILFGYGLSRFYQIVSSMLGEKEKLCFHLHEWMSALPLVLNRFPEPNTSRIFTTHATLLGRYLSSRDPHFYEHLEYYNPQKEADFFGLRLPNFIEKSAALNSQIMSTVSSVTDEECTLFLDRPSDFILPNGLNIQRFTALHEFQNLHKIYKEKIHQFTMGHFFHNQIFDLDKTLYFFSSGRFEFHNKGFDVTLEALGLLNNLLKASRSDMTVVFFLVTNRPVSSFNPEVLEGRALLEEVRSTCDQMVEQIRGKLLEKTITTGSLPNLDELVDDYWKLRLRRNLQAYSSDVMPKIVTHNLVSDQDDPVLRYLRDSFLLNFREDPVKVIYHPQFLNPQNPLFGMEYGDFVRGCHLGIFPGSYEPWGYTPMECLSRGVPAVTSDLCGFGQYAQKTFTDARSKGIYVLPRRGKEPSDSAHQLANILYDFTLKSRRDRIHQRNLCESSSVDFDWSKIYQNYLAAYREALNT